MKELTQTQRLLIVFYIVRAALIIAAFAQDMVLSRSHVPIEEDYGH
jgi:hypothetical protein